ncbi:MAG: hypothetical protein NTW06_02930, partial [Candidatus Falkowbacteria bacterium]|nr:hypothetical protein [Candidatus Falkowbacteria bacterium]
MNKEFFIKNKKIFFVVYLLIVFFLSIAIWLTPILFKGYPAASPEWRTFILARNYSQSGVLGSEDKLNITVAPELVKEKVQPSSLGNKLTAIAYALIFKLLGQQSWGHILLIAAIVHALSLVILTILCYYLFGFLVAAIFPLIYALLPFNCEIVQFLGTYEFAILFFSI